MGKLVKVRIKTWVTMAQQYGLIGRNIKVPGVFTSIMEEYLPDDRIIIVTKKDGDNLYYSWDQCNISPEMIDEYLHLDYKPKGLYISKNTYNRIVTICGLPKTDNQRLPVDSKVFQMLTDKTLNSTGSKYIYNSAKGDFKLKGDSNSVIKLGKLLKLLYPELDSTEIETYVSRWKSMYTVDTSRVKESSDITDVYAISSVGGSCMARCDMTLYENLGCKVLYILNEYNESLAARAILWDNNVEYTDSHSKPFTLCDRVFFDKEYDKLTILAYCREKGYTNYSTITGQVQTTTTTGPCETVPYVDTLCYVSEVSPGKYKLSSDCGNGFSDDILQNTNGTSSDDSGISEQAHGVYCTDIDDYCNEEDVYYIEEDDIYYYSDEELVYIDGTYYREDSDSIVFTEDNGYQLMESCYEDYYGNLWATRDNLVHCEDVNDLVHIDDTYWAEDLDCYYRYDDDLHYYDGDYHSEPKYEEDEGK